jgi:uridine kinase
MHIEIIGSTSAGKTTLARKMVQAGAKTGQAVYLSDDFMLERSHLNWIGNKFIRWRLVEVIAFAVALPCLSRYSKFIDFVLREGQNSPGSRFYKINRIRNVIRKIGVFEFVTQKAEPQQIVLVDNEGILQGVHNLFVHQDSQTDLEKITRYVELVPLPNIVLYLQQDEAVLVSRTLSRGHGRVARAQASVAHFIKQAILAFEAMVKLPVIRERLLVVDGQLNIQSNDVEPEKAVFRQAMDLIQSGRMMQ